MFIEKIANNSNIYSLKSYEFFKGQDMIARKYMPRLKDLSDIDIIDKYILQIIEEIWEVINAKDYSEKLEEICDVAMYTGSLYTIICNMIKIDVTSIKDEAFIESDNFEPYKIIDSLISFRRCFPSRKWHKKEVIEVDGDYIKNIGLDLLKTEIINIFSFLIFNMEQEDFDFIKYITNKQKFIYELDEVKTPNNNYIRTITKEEIEELKKTKTMTIEAVSIPLNQKELEGKGYSIEWVEIVEDNKYLCIYKDRSRNLLFHSKEISNKDIVLLEVSGDRDIFYFNK